MLLIDSVNAMMHAVIALGPVPIYRSALFELRGMGILGNMHVKWMKMKMMEEWTWREGVIVSQGHIHKMSQRFITNLVLPFLNVIGFQCGNDGILVDFNSHWNLI